MRGSLHSSARRAFRACVAHIDKDIGFRLFIGSVCCFLALASLFGCELTTTGAGTDRSRNIRELERAVVDLERKVDEITLQLSKLDKRLKEYEKGLNTGGSGAGEETIKEEKITGDETGEEVASAPGADETPKIDVGDGGGSSEKDLPKDKNPQELYDRALKEILDRNAEKALPLFIDFVGSYPNHELTDNAYYWIGECYYSLKKFELALENFNIVNERFPESAKKPDALLKMGYSYVELGDRERAKEVLSDLVSKYPDNSSADLARKRLLELK